MSSKNKNTKLAFLLFICSFSLAFTFQNCAPNNASNASSHFKIPDSNEMIFNVDFSSTNANTALSSVQSPLSSKQIVLDTDIQCLPAIDTAIPVSKHLQYTGMLSSMGSDAIDFETWKTDISATLKMGNLQGVELVILPNDPTHAKSLDLMKKKLSFLSQYNVKIVLIVQRILFDANGKLFSNYTTNWSKVISALSSFKPLINSVYIYDEPFWNVLTNEKNGNTAFVSATEMYNNLNTAGLLIHQTLPGTALVFIEAYPMINDSLKIPDVFDWIGMDCYTGFENCEGQSIPKYYETLKKLQPNKKLVILPPAMIFKKAQDITPADRTKVKDIYLQYMNWIASEPNIITSFSFIYRYDQTIEVFTGANKLCESADIHRLFWRKFSRLKAEGLKNPTFSCAGSGPLSTYSMTFGFTASNYDAGVSGHYFVGGFNVINNSWYLYADNKWSLYDGTEASVISIPAPAISASLSGPLFTQQNLSSAPNGKIYLGYGIGSHKMEAWNNMLINNQYAQCAVLPAQ